LVQQVTERVLRSRQTNFTSRPEFPFHILFLEDFQMKTALAWLPIFRDAAVQDAGQYRSGATVVTALIQPCAGHALTRWRSGPFLGWSPSGISSDLRSPWQAF
jgi:hypothetical protein